MEFIQAIFSMAKGTVMESMFGIMGKNLKGSGGMAKRMGLEYGDLLRGTITKVSGRTTGSMERDIISTLVGLSIEAILKISSKAEKGHKSFKMEINTQVRTNRVNLTATASTHGQMETATKENSSMVQDKERVYSAKQTVRSTKENSRTIQSMVWAHRNTNQDSNSLVNSKRASDSGVR